jgi:hypothetical protein
MARKKSRTLLIGIVVLAAIIGAVAIGIGYFYSKGDDIAPTNTQADELLTRCSSLSAVTADGTEILSDTVINPNDPTTISATFVFDPSSGSIAQFSHFVFTINSNEVSQIPIDDPSVETISTNTGIITYIVTTEVTDYEDATSITVEASAISDSGVTLESPVCTAIYSVDQDATIDGCLEAGENGTNSSAEQCCSGLAQISCNTVNESDNSCEEVTDCFTCTEQGTDGSTSNDVCSEWENTCNNPGDCEEEEEEETTSCIESGQQGILGPNTACCEGLTPISCDQLNDANQCIEQANCLACVDSIIDGICGDGENSCNSPDDCEGVTEEEEEEPAEEEEAPGGLDESNFSVTIEGATCVERVAPNNTSQFTVTITNNAEEYQDISDIVASPPLGFIYIENSTIINGEADNTDEFITTEMVGSSQELTWSTPPGWSVAPGESMILLFSATAGSTALTGDVLMEVVVTPTNIPLNATSLRGEYAFTTAQTCNAPVTGIFDQTIAKIIAGVFVVIASLFFYLSNTGRKVSLNLVESNTARKAELFGLKITNPRKHFEEKVTDSIKKDKKKR